MDWVEILPLVPFLLLAAGVLTILTVIAAGIVCKALRHH